MTGADDTPPTIRAHGLRGSMQRLLRENIFRRKPVHLPPFHLLSATTTDAPPFSQPKPQKPLISSHSNNVFHDQALIQLADVYQSLQLGDSHEATMTVYSTGVRIFGREHWERAVQERGVRSRGGYSTY